MSLILFGWANVLVVGLYLVPMQAKPSYVPESSPGPFSGLQGVMY